MKPNIIKQNITDEILTTLKVLSGKDNIKIEFSDIENNFYAWNQNLISEEKVILPQADNLLQSRAAVDLVACYLLFHNHKIYHEFVDDENFSLTGEEKKIYEDLERMRVVAGVRDVYLGVVKNILQKNIADKKAKNFSEQTKEIGFDILFAREIFADFKEKIVGFDEAFSVGVGSELASPPRRGLSPCSPWRLKRQSR